MTLFLILLYVEICYTFGCSFFVWKYHISLSLVDFENGTSKCFKLEPVHDNKQWGLASSIGTSFSQSFSFIEYAMKRFLLVFYLKTFRKIF